MDYRNYSDKKRMKGIYRFVKRVYRNVIERNHRRSLLESYGKEREGCRSEREKERCSGSYCQAVGFLVIKDDSISKRPG